MVYPFLDEDSSDITFCWNEMVILSVNLNKINLEFDEDKLYTIILIKLLAWRSKFKKRKKELNEEMKKEMEPIFTE